MTDIYLKLYESLPIGKKNAVKITDVCEINNISPQFARGIIKQLRDKYHMPVCSLNHSGYYRPKDIGELTEFKDYYLNCYVKPTQRTNYHLSRCIERFGQEAIEEQQTSHRAI